jgi:hypothetical protein
MSEFVKKTPEGEGKKVKTVEHKEDIVGPILLQVRGALMAILQGEVAILSEHEITVDEAADRLLDRLDMNPPKAIQSLLMNAQPPVISTEHKGLLWNFPNNGLDDNGNLLDVIEKALANIKNEKVTSDEDEKSIVLVDEDPIRHPRKTWVLSIIENGKGKGARVFYHPYGREE